MSKETNKTKNTKLRTCPFCKTIPKMQEFHNRSGRKFLFIRCINARCKVSSMTSFFSNEKQVVNAWNERNDNVRYRKLPKIKGYKKKGERK